MIVKNTSSNLSLNCKNDSDNLSDLFLLLIKILKKRVIGTIKSSNKEGKNMLKNENTNQRKDINLEIN